MGFAQYQILKTHPPLSRLRAPGAVHRHGRPRRDVLGVLVVLPGIAPGATAAVVQVGADAAAPPGFSMGIEGAYTGGTIFILCKGPGSVIMYTQKRKSLQCMLGKLKHHLTASPRPLSRQRPCKTSIPNVTAAFKKMSALLSLKIILSYFAVERWLSRSHMCGKVLMLRMIPDKFLNQHSPHKAGGVTEK